MKERKPKAGNLIKEAQLINPFSAHLKLPGFFFSVFEILPRNMVASHIDSRCFYVCYVFSSVHDARVNLTVTMNATQILVAHRDKYSHEFSLAVSQLL